jgi:hypothetical protein
MTAKLKEVETKVEEDKAEKFRRLGRKRFVKAVERLQMFIPLANRGSYSYTDEQIAHLVGRLRDEVDKIEAAFEAAKNRPRDEINIEL